jgi:phospholipid transport system transporter-binding protein
MALPAELTLDNVATLLADADALVAAGSLDLSPVRNVDSAGIAFLLELTRRARRVGKTLTLSGASEQVRRLAAFFELESALNFS